MTDRFSPVPLPALFTLIMDQIAAGHYFGMPIEVFYQPKSKLFDTPRFGKTLGTPLGPAAGPHTQLSQNMVGAWLCGARYLELKTVQTLDELDVAKPCIDMQEEGYNCEWSQELPIHQSFEQYLDAWIIIHLLAAHLKWNGAAEKTIFNMSIGYNLEGILQDNIQWFFQKMNNCSQELNGKIKELAKMYSWVDKIHIPVQISNNVTLSTMHGCPPREIEKIGMYLIKERRLHTLIKFNPTLLGATRVREILNHTLGYKTPVPNEAFEHDLKYPDALAIIRNLEQAATHTGVFFGLKLTNTLESNNFRNIFAEEQKQMYMSGKALHPLAVNVAAKIREDFPRLDISFSAGADCFNFQELLACNLSPITVSSDLLKPGGYGRLSQYLSQLEETLHHQGKDIQDFMQQNPGDNLRVYSQKVIHDPAYKKAFREPNIKTLRPLNTFDCIHAPCMTTCPGDQNIPLYMHYVANENWQKAFEVILQTNPFPTITGTVCDHDCQSKCTRINYDSTLAIREIKRFVAEFKHDETFIQSLPSNGQKANIIGAGPAGLACAWYLKLYGFEVDVYEEKEAAGGMVQQVIPDFRMTEAEIESDISRIASLGVNMHFNAPVTKAMFDQWQASGDFIFVGIGATNTRKLGIPGEEHPQVHDPLKFLAGFKNHRKRQLEAKNILVIGGGNTAMDVARTAQKFAAPDARVSIIYRRTLQDMPASAEEILAAMNEGVLVRELLAPQHIIIEKGHIKTLKCIRMQVKGRDKTGRQQVQPMEGGIVSIEADMIIPAVGQLTKWEFVGPEMIKAEHKGYSTNLGKVFIGGDARSGASNIISAIADGRNAAREMAQQAGVGSTLPITEKYGKANIKDLLVRKATRIKSRITSAHGHGNTINSYAQARTEAQRCLLCDEICNICVTVCPNFANQSYETIPMVWSLQTATQDEQGKITLKDALPFRVEQNHQIYNIADFCNECGNCRTFCPTMGAPYLDKPKIHLSEESWNNAGEGFRLTQFGGEKGIEYKDKQGDIHLLYINSNNGILTYKSPQASAQLNKVSLRIENIRFVRNGHAEVSMELAATMYMLLKGVHLG